MDFGTPATGITRLPCHRPPPSQEGVRGLHERAAGVYWARGLVHWTSKPSILGRQQVGAEAVNMAAQVGIYLLYDGREVIYVGRAIDQPLGTRLYQHTRDRLEARWDRFSWFGLHAVTDKGEVVPASTAVTTDALIRSIEAVLIEAMEPRQNRRRGDDLDGIEYLQAKDPRIEKEEQKRLFREIEAKFVRD